MVSYVQTILKKKVLLRFIMRRGGDEDFVARIPEELVERWEVTWENGRDD